MYIPDAATETTTGLLFASVSVTTEPAAAEEPFGRTTPDEPGRTLMVLVPITAIGVCEAVGAAALFCGSVVTVFAGSAGAGLAAAGTVAGLAALEVVVVGSKRV